MAKPLKQNDTNMYICIEYCPNQQIKAKQANQSACIACRLFILGYTSKLLLSVRSGGRGLFLNLSAKAPTPHIFLQSQGPKRQVRDRRDHFEMVGLKNLAETNKHLGSPFCHLSCIYAQSYLQLVTKCSKHVK